MFTNKITKKKLMFIAWIGAIAFFRSTCPLLVGILLLAGLLWQDTFGDHYK